MRRVLLSVKPEFVEKIFRSDKTVELRKKIPTLDAGDEVLIYASSPVMALVGAIEVVDVVREAPHSLWKLVKAHAAVERSFYDLYYQDRDTAYGIFIGRTRLFEYACTLPSLREVWPGFRPPQNYRYVEVWGSSPRPSVMTARTVVPEMREGQIGLSCT